MAFQTGTPVDPRLGRADVSGFARAGMITGQALANLGSQVGEGIERYQKNKQITASSLAQLEGSMAADPSILLAMQQAGEANPTIGKALKALREGDYKQQDVLALSGFASSLQSQKDAAQQARLLEAQIGQLEAEAEAGGRIAPEKAVTGREITMKELENLRGKGFKPTVEFGPGGEMVLTSMGTFAPQPDVPKELTPGQKKLEEALGANMEPWMTGGRTQAVDNLRTYDELITGLTSGEIDTRRLSDLTPEALGIDDTIRQIFNPTGQNAVDNVRRVVFQGLKDTLGAQFTQREAERLVSASYNPALPEEMNIKRLQSARRVLADVIQAKDDLANHIMAGGLMSDYKGISPVDAFESGIKDVEQEYASEPEKGGFQAPSGINIRLKSKRPSK